MTGVFVISFSAIIVRAAHVAPGTAAALRCIYALPVLALIASRAPVPARRALAPALAGGVVLGLNLVFWHHAIDRIGAGFSTVLANTHVVFVLAGVLAAGGAVARRSLLALPLPLAGVVLIGGFGSGSQLDGVGVALALVAGAAYAAFQLLFDRSIRLSGGDRLAALRRHARAARLGAGGGDRERRGSRAAALGSGLDGAAGARPADARLAPDRARRRAPARLRRVADADGAARADDDLGHPRVRRGHARPAGRGRRARARGRARRAALAAPGCGSLSPVSTST